MTGKIGRILLVICLVSFSVGILAFLANTIDVGNLDYMGYWAAGKQLIHRASPYDSAAILSIERAQGYTDVRPNVSLDLPAAFFLVLPLGLVGAKTGWVLWFLAFIACFLGSVHLLRKLHGQPENNLHLLCFLFAPVYVCMMAGQLGAFLLLGVVLFLYFCNSHPFWGGASLLLCTVKPHLFLPIAAVLLVWVLRERAFRVIAGIAVALAASCALSLIFDPHAWSEYSSMLRSNPGIQRDFVPTLSVLFRLAVDRNAMWLQYVPVAGACVWAVWYFWKRRLDWNWLEDGMLLLLVSELCAPHGWFTDEVMVLPAMLAALYATKNLRMVLLFSLLSAVALAEFFAGAKLTSAYFIWTAPAWLAWYLLARRLAPKTGLPTPALPE
jgi:hypothetical protein